MAVAREYLRFTQEATWGTFNGSATSAQIMVAQLTAANSWTVRAIPNYWSLRSAGGSNRPVTTGTSTTDVKGKFTTKLYPSQAKLLCALAINLSSTPLDLGSFTADHATLYDDGTGPLYRRYLGCKFGSGSIAATNGADPVVSFSFDVVGKQPATITVTDFPEPTFVSTPAYPTDNPYQFKEIAGNLTLGASRTSLRSFTLNVGNELRTPKDEGQYISQNKWTGRANTLEVDFRFLGNTDRANWEAATKLAAQFSLFDGVNTALFQMNGANVLSGVTDDLAWGDPGMYQKIMLGSYVDPAASPVGDLVFSQSP
jgi:hypothetical protein